MSLEVSPHTSPIVPETRHPRPWFLLAMLVCAAGLALWGVGRRSSRLWSPTPTTLATLEIDRGDVAQIVVENGSLESANNATARCQVEALIGMTGGTQAGGQGGRGGQGGQGGQGAGGTAGGAGGGGSSTPAPSTPTKAAPAKKAGSGSTAAGKTATKGASSGSASAADPSAAGGGQSADASGATATNTTKKPTIRSFNYTVAAHVPLRPRTVKVVQPKAQIPIAPQGGGGGGGGGRGGGGGGGRGGDPNQVEKPGATRIISILPEGTHVKAGDVVCRLDSSAFETELQAQRIRYVQAKAWVEQAQAILDVTEITLQEYRDGIHPQDTQLIRQYLATCKIELDRAQRNLDWSRETSKKGLRTAAQLKADVLGLQRAEIALHEAEVMTDRLERSTAPKLLKSLEAKLEAIRADKLTQAEAFQLESDRLKKLETAVAHCTMTAPREGIVVYYTQANGRGQVQDQIEEGVTVREGQPIFQLPDPKHMQVKAKINESKVAFIHSGLPALIRIDAFPDRPLHGTVTEITAIPAPVNRASPDIKGYFATVKIDTGGFDALRPGLSAEVEFLIEARHQVTRIPLRAVRWAGVDPFVAVASATGPSWQWHRVALGLSDPTYAEVLSGLKPGDRVVADPEALPPPHAVAETQAPPQPGVATR